MAVPVIDLSGETRLIVEQVGRARAEHPPRYEPLTALDHVTAKAAKTH